MADGLLFQIAAFTVLGGASVLFALMAWAGRHMS